MCVVILHYNWLFSLIELCYIYELKLCSCAFINGNSYRSSSYHLYHTAVIISSNKSNKRIFLQKF